MKAVSGFLIELLPSKSVPAGRPCFSVVMVLRTIVVVMVDVLQRGEKRGHENITGRVTVW